MIYVIANLSFFIENVAERDIWKRFAKLTYNAKKVDCSVDTNSKCMEIHGIQYERLPFLVEHLSRIGADIMLCSRSWDRAKIASTSGDVERMDMFLLQLFYIHAAQKQMIQIHSSLVNCEEQGLMFLGPSGIGKTTQAELWNKYRNALIINGDIVFVQETPDAFLGWGTPWHGSSPYCENTSVPLKAMIVLKQSPENSIRELTGFEKVTAVSNNVFYPRWLENGMELCLETLDHLLSRIPVYELSCRPDEEAVKLTEETIFGSSSVSD